MFAVSAGQGVQVRSALVVQSAAKYVPAGQVRLCVLGHRGSAGTMPVEDVGNSEKVPGEHAVQTRLLVPMAWAE